MGPTRWLGLFLSVALLLAACSADAQTTPAPAGTKAPVAAATAAAQKEVTVTFAWTQAPGQVEPAIAGFEKSHPGIKVKFEQIPFAQFNEVMQNRLAGGDASPDVFGADMPRVAALVSRGFLLDLTDKVPNFKGVVTDATAEACQVNGRLYSLPVNTSTQLLFFNVDLLKKAGIDPPTADPQKRWTWEFVSEQAKKAQQAGAKWGLMFDQISRYYQMQPLPESLGGGSGVTGDKMLTPAITNSAWVKATTFYGKIFADRMAPRGVPPQETSALFKSGAIAFYVGGTWRASEFMAEKGLNFGVGAHPFFAGGKPVTPTGAWSWGINPNSKNKDAALEFLKYSSLDPAGAELTNSKLTLPPAHTALLAKYGQRPEFQGPNMKGVAELMEFEMKNTAVNRPRTSGYIQFETIMEKVFEDIRNGADPTSTLQKASKDLEAAWSRL